MTIEDRVGGIVNTLREVAPALSGNPVAVWQAARDGTQTVANALPDVVGLEQVKDFVRKYPVVATCVALAVGYYLLGGRSGRKA